jgi:DNA repair protein RadC
MTERISRAGEILGIKLLDHVVIGENGTYSFRNSGRLP